jgi:outer membrane biogenesis lipoprotein LolB
MHERNIDNIKDERVVRLEQQNLAQKQYDIAERRQEGTVEYDPYINNEVKVLERKLEAAKENRRRNSLRLENECQQQ